MDRALQKINYREDQDRLNIWKARLNLETLYGDDDSLHAQFNEAKRCNDEQKIYSTLIDIHIESGKFTAAIVLLRDAVKKFATEIEVWSFTFWVELGSYRTKWGRKLAEIWHESNVHRLLNMITVVGGCKDNSI